MIRKARISLSSSPFGLHARPCMQIAAAVGGLDVTILFSRDEDQVEIDAKRSPALSILGASAQLGLTEGVVFDITCSGTQADEAFIRLKNAFTGEYFEGTSFQEIPGN